MKVLNLLWGFSTGGIGRCFLTYDRIGEASTKISIQSVCIDIGNRDYDRSPLYDQNIDIIRIKNPFDVSWLKKVRNHIRKNNPDVIFCHGFNGPVIIWIIKKLYRINIPMVCSYHGAYHPPTKLKRIVAPVYNHVQIFLYRLSAHRVITVENQSRKFLICKGVPKNKIVTVFNGIPVGKTENDTGNNNRRNNLIKLCTISRLDAVKGLDYLIRALPLAISEIASEIRLYVIGDGPEYRRLQSLVTTLGLEKTVVFKNYRRDTDHWLADADIYLLPSLSECHSISLLEAMRAGKAIITTNVGGNPETLRDGQDGLIVPPADADAIAGAVIQLATRPALRDQLGQNAKRRFLDYYTETTMLNNLVKVFESIG